MRLALRHRARAVAVAVVVAATTAPAAATAASSPVELGLHGQARHIVGPAADDPATGEDEGALPARNELQLRRLRLGAKARRGPLRARLLLAVDRGKARLLTGTLRWRLRDGLDLEVGQHKRLLSQGYLDSSSHQRMPERAELYDAFAGERDIGASLRLRPHRRLDLRLAVWNGAGPNVVGNDTGRLWVEGRIDLGLGARFDLEDPQIGRRLAARVGVAAVSGRRSAVRSDKTGVLTRADAHLGASGHVALRWQRIELRGEVLWQRDEPIDARTAPTTALALSDVPQLGLVAQLAWQPLPELEVAARFARHEADRHDADRWTQWLELGVGWRPGRDDDRKLQLAVQRERDGRSGGQTYDRLRVVTQLQWRL